jgi:hypothetical protein
LTNENYFIPNPETGQASNEFSQLDDETQFEFGGCSQEEISNLVDQVLSSIDVFSSTNDADVRTTPGDADVRTTSVDADADARPSNGTLCQDCGNFVLIDSSPGVLIIKLFSSLTDVRNKLECLSLAGLSSLVFLQVRPRAYHRVGYLKRGWLVLFENI